MSDLNEAFSQLRYALDGRELPFLDQTYYAEAHALFESCSNQRSLIVDWLCKWMTDNFPNSSSLTILSVGCGKGIVDFQLASHLINDSSSLVYVGIEPHAEDANTCQRLMDSVDDVKANVIVGQWPNCASNLSGKQFDVILFIHCLYHMVDVGEALDEASRLLKPQGQVIVFMGPRTGLNELCLTLAPPQHGGLLPLWWAETVKSAIDKRGYNVVHESILNARIDLSLCCDETSWEGKAILDFAVFACIPDDLRSYVLKVVRALTNAQLKAESSDKLIVNHPVHVWVLQQ